MNDFYTVVANKAIDTLIPILIVWLVALAHLAIAWLQKRNLLSDAEYIQKQIETKQGWAYDAVLAVEDAYKELGGRTSCRRRSARSWPRLRLTDFLIRWMRSKTT